jgi:anti-sigma factor ChrR (cupin superfamily)
MSPTTVPSDLLPRLLTGFHDDTFDVEELDFQPLLTDGRTGVEMHRLYGPDQTGPGGPSAGLVRYAPGASTPAHLHPGYELIYVLDGQMETDAGVFEAHSLLVQPPSSTHQPRSSTGCLLLIVWEKPVEQL